MRRRHLLPEQLDEFILSLCDTHYNQHGNFTFPGSHTQEVTLSQCERSHNKNTSNQIKAPQKKFTPKENNKSIQTEIDFKWNINLSHEYLGYTGKLTDFASA